jgi:hypothetical protein
MSKTLTVLALVGLALVLVTGPTLAAGTGHGTVLAQQKVGPKTKPHVISFTGKITAINRASRSMSVYIQMTNTPFRVKRGTTQPVTVTSSTVYYLWDGKTRTRWSFDRLAVGDKVSINALATSTSITARRVEVNKPRY